LDLYLPQLGHTKLIVLFTCNITPDGFHDHSDNARVSYLVIRHCCCNESARKVCMKFNSVHFNDWVSRECKLPRGFPLPGHTWSYWSCVASHAAQLSYLVELIRNIPVGLVELELELLQLNCIKWSAFVILVNADKDYRYQLRV